MKKQGNVSQTKEQDKTSKLTFMKSSLLVLLSHPFFSTAFITIYDPICSLMYLSVPSLERTLHEGQDFRSVFSLSAYKRD